MIKFIFFIFFGYLFFKALRFLKVIFFNIKSNSEDHKVYPTDKASAKIDKKDIIDAQFEEIDINEQSTPKK